MPPDKIIADVLIVDDDGDIRECLCAAVSMLGYAAYTAADRNDALKIVKNQNIDVVILDWQMPGLPAREFLARLQKYPRIDVMLCSAAYHVAEKAGELKLRHYLPKPFDIKALETSIQSCINKTHIHPKPRIRNSSAAPPAICIYKTLS